MDEDYEVVWAGRDELTDVIDRDYAAMRGEGWDLIWEPTSPLVTDWERYRVWALPDFERHVEPAQPRRGPRRQALRILKDWSREYTGIISQGGSHR